MDGLTASVEKMRREGLPEAAIDTFAFYYDQLVSGQTGMVAEDEIEPLADVADAEQLPDADAAEHLDQAVIIRLNGGLGTSMGMTRAKSLLPVKEGLTFLDVIARQVIALRRSSGARLPLVLMNSFHTRADSLAALERHPEIASDVPADFMQHKEPKIRVDDLQPVEWPADPGKEWCPPGHGDIYTALLTSGMLEELIAKGYRYAFIANSDNLGAVLEPRILAWFAASGAPFASEVTDRTPADRKGGHVARLRDGGLVLRETAQTRPEDMDAFTDVERHRYFNCNNLWVDLHALRDELRRRDGVLGLPMIVNAKTADPGDAASPPVYQLETAMGSAVGVFAGAQVLRVPRRRFTPVKTTSDLLVVRSDAYVLTEAGFVEPAASRDGRAPLVSLDSHYKLLHDFEARIPEAPSLVECESLTVRGDVAFGRGVVVRGSVEVVQDSDGQRRIEDGTVLTG
ncbi:MAG: UTP--glucose-1-phosphate uridylyltransferase [uncultured Solirubrobacteraceae bacterium]|uniref:UTP--glucose-1-phosphate uridylyltransferase n=1 Tax=uncultured Solirubrobacteraceae bacterium TaxID=1162706 RepID=A0A6J4RGG7_9ACTN|nr:MAG: UTP--glucose-1-phosphate uridylyltransferase [uncultured Solirubrobacteraceae bacterium]